MLDSFSEAADGLWAINGKDERGTWKDDLSRGSRDVSVNLRPLSDAEQQRNRPRADFLRGEGGGMRDDPKPGDAVMR
jgi:hypothetical protein